MSIVPKQRGKFITFEGLDGVGKSTQLEKLAGWLREQGIDVVTTREPGGTGLGQKLRSVLLSSRTAGLSPLAELALMFADRAQHVDEQIIPALQAGQWVLCDRFTDSSEAYQGAGRGIGTAAVLALHKTLCHDLKPDVTVLMVGDLGHSLARARRRNVEQSKQSEEDENRFEKESRAFHKRVLDAYTAIAQREPERIVKVDATQDIPKVHKRIIAALEEKLRLTDVTPKSTRQP